MAFEIQEIAIQMQVANEAQQSADQTGNAVAGTAKEREALLRECVRRVLQAIKESRER